MQNRFQFADVLNGLRILLGVPYFLGAHAEIDALRPITDSGALSENLPIRYE
jgi:hypothetical protein